MNTGSLIIGIVLVLLFVVPIYFLSRKSSNKDKKMLAYFKNQAEQNGLNVSQTEIWNNSYYIGIDQEAGKLFYLKKIEENEEKVLIGLREIEKCRVDNIFRTIKEGKYSTNITDRIDLKIKLNNSNGSEKTIEFYNAHGTGHLILSDQLHLAEKWAKIINQNINNK